MRLQIIIITFPAYYGISNTSINDSYPPNEEWLSRLHRLLWWRIITRIRSRPSRSGITSAETAWFLLVILFRAHQRNVWIKRIRILYSKVSKTEMLELFELFAYLLLCFSLFKICAIWPGISGCLSGAGETLPLLPKRVLRAARSVKLVLRTWALFPGSCWRRRLWPAESPKCRNISRNYRNVKCRVIMES